MFVKESKSHAKADHYCKNIFPYRLLFCSFKSKYRLNVHMDMHRSVKYRCPHCPMELSTRRTLRMHLLVHKEEKAYVCKVCSKAFRRSKDLKVFIIQDFYNYTVLLVIRLENYLQNKLHIFKKYLTLVDIKNLVKPFNH